QMEAPVLGPDLPFECPERPAGRDSHIVERIPRVPVCLKCFRLPPRAVERKHQLTTQTLPVRMPRNQPLQLTDELGVSAKGEIRVDPILQNRQPQLHHAPSLDRSERLLHALRQRRTAPQRKRFLEQPSRLPPATLPGCDSTLPPQPLETKHVNSL